MKQLPFDKWRSGECEPFPRLKEKFYFEERGERNVMLNLMVLLYNFQASKVGQNQIRNIYMPFLNRNALDYIR